MIRQFAKVKVLAQRGNVYVNGLSSFMIFRVFLKGAGVHSWWATVGLFAAALGGIVFLMWVEDKIGVFRAESEYATSRNPGLVKLIEAADEKRP